MVCIYLETVLNGLWRKIFFLICPRHGDQGLIVVIVWYFITWTKTEHIIFISSVISSHMGPMYIETPNISVHILCEYKL